MQHLCLGARSLKRRPKCCATLIAPQPASWNHKHMFLHSLFYELHFARDFIKTHFQSRYVQHEILQMNWVCRWWQHSPHTPWIKLLCIHLTWPECKGKCWANAMKSIATECWFLGFFSPLGRPQRRLTRRLDKSLFIILSTAAWHIQSINQRLGPSKMWTKFLNGERRELSILRSLAVDVSKAMKNSATQFIIFWEIYHQSDTTYHGYIFCLENLVSDVPERSSGAAGRQLEGSPWNTGLIYLGSCKDSFHQCLGACPGVSTRLQGVNTFYLVHGIAKKWNLLLSKPAERRWASKKLGWKQMRFNTKMENEPVPWSFLKVKLTQPKVPARTLVKLGINRKKKKVGHCVCETKVFFSVLTKIYFGMCGSAKSVQDNCLSEKVWAQQQTHRIPPHPGLSPAPCGWMGLQTHMEVL